MMAFIFLEIIFATINLKISSYTKKKYNEIFSFPLIVFVFNLCTRNQ